MSTVQQISLAQAVRNQLAFKLKAYSNVIGSLIIFQFIGLLLSFADEMSAITTEHMTVTLKIISGNMMITFSWLWAFIVSLYITNRASKYMMATFVSNKRSNHLANILFMLVISAIGAVTAVLLTVAFRLVVIIYYGINNVALYDYLSISGLIIAIVATFLYTLLIFSFGYFIGEAIQLHRSFVFLVPLLLFALFIFSVNVFGDVYVLAFYFLETNLFIFSIKVITTVVILWFVATLFGRRLEVRTL